MIAARLVRLPVIRLGTAAYTGCLVFSIALAVLARGWRVGIACAVGLGLAALFYRAGLAALRRPWLWVLVIFLVLPSAFLGDNSDPDRFEVAFTQQGLAVGIQMALRALTILLAVGGFTASVSVTELAGLLERAGLKGLGFALGVAFNVLPIVQETATTTYHALRLRGGLRRQPLRAVRLLLVTIVVNSLRHAEDIVSAAEARAFSVTRTRPLRLNRQPADLFLIAVLVVAGAMILWL